MTRRAWALWIAASLCLSPGDRADAAGDDQGANLAATCAPCHRLDGRNTGIPSITGLASATLAGMIRSFRSDETSNHIMHAVSLTLSDNDVHAVALYLATLGKETKQR